MDDPLFSANPQERDSYREDVMQKMRDAIEQDRSTRRASSDEESAPGPIIGSTGMPGSIWESV